MVRTVATQNQTDSPQADLLVLSAIATVTAEGVLIRWRTNSATDNVGFNVYRLKEGERTRVNREIIPGAVFASGAEAKLRGGYSYSWFDRGGAADATYFIESVSLQGTTKTYEPLSPVTSKTVSVFPQTPGALNGESANAADSTGSFEKGYPAAETQTNSPQGTLEDQWALAAQPALKISIKKDGWYRVTQPQMVAAGFSPNVDIKNLRLFVDAQEVAINTSQHNGPFGSGDYIEFYGSGLDKPTTDTRIYYLIAGTTPGKRVRGQIQLDGEQILPPVPTSTPGPTAPSPVSSPPATQNSPDPVLQDPIFFSWAQNDLLALMGSLRTDSGPVKDTPKESNAGAGSLHQLNDERHDDLPVSDRAASGSAETNSEGALAKNQASASVSVSHNSSELVKQPVANENIRLLPVPVPTKQPIASVTAAHRTITAGRFRKRTVSKRKRRSTQRREFKVERSHAPSISAAAPPNFSYTSERKDRGVYFVTVLNGDAENFFGQVITFNSTNPASQTINSPNPDLSAAGTAQLEIALQGVNQVFHQISVEFNGVVVGSFAFFGFDPASGGHPVQVFNIPISQLHDGANTIRFILPAGGDVSIVDYTKLTYPHLFRYEKATGNIHLVNQPNDGDALVVGNKTYTFKTSPTTNLHIGIGVDKQTTAANISNRVNLDTVDTLCTAVSGPADVGLTANTSGTAGNVITLGVDGVRLTKTLFADPGALKFMLRGTHAVAVDGFSTPSVRLIDYTDPLNVGISRPASVPSSSGFAITVPTSEPPSKPQRLLYAIPDGQFSQPAGLSLNQPSTLNQGILSQTITSGADFLIITHKDFIASMAPLLTQRHNIQGLTAAAVDVEDVFDEFSYGVHGPQAIRDFLSYASTLNHWSTKPRYVIFAGDASLDPRNYQGIGNFDFVPTKLIDATFNETASDDWFTDFDGDGIANIPVGRLPVRTAAQATAEISKIVNFAPAHVQQTALLVADDHNNPPYYYDFGAASDQLANLIAPSLTIQKVYRSGTSCEERADIIAAFNEGRALVNYIGHGSVDVWAGACPDPANPGHNFPEFGSDDAAALTNGNKLSFVVVLDCLNGYFHDPALQGIAESLMNNPNGGAVAAFASSGLTLPEGPHAMSQQLYSLIYSAQPIALGDAIKIAKGATNDIDVRTTWIFFGDPSLKIR